MVRRVRLSKAILKGENTVIPKRDFYIYPVLYLGVFLIVARIIYALGQIPDANKNSGYYLSVAICIVYMVCLVLTVINLFLLALLRNVKEKDLEEVVLHEPHPRMPMQEKFWQKLLRFAPAVCTLVFSLLIFAFMAAPVYSMLGFGENYYASFNATSTTGYYMAITISMMFFAFIGVIYGIAAVFRSRNQLKITDYVVMLTLNVVHLIIAAVTMSQVTSQMLEAGAGPILILVFDILFTAGIATCLGFDIKLKGYKALKPDPVTPDSKLGRSIGILPIVAMLLSSCVCYAVSAVSERLVTYDVSWIYFPIKCVCILFIFYLFFRINYYVNVAINGRKRISPWEVVIGIITFIPVLYFGASVFFPYISEISEDIHLLYDTIAFSVGIACIALGIMCTVLNSIFKRQYKSSNVAEQSSCTEKPAVSDNSVAESVSGAVATECVASNNRKENLFAANVLNSEADSDNASKPTNGVDSGDGVASSSETLAGLMEKMRSSEQEGADDISNSKETLAVLLEMLGKRDKTTSAEDKSKEDNGDDGDKE
ncbi:MAG: hypothetical protein NC132_00005 [Corallococcus sp.]|nr:hypothetical protein [Corallococcus sp.]